jgi:hypothetical protein
MPGYAEVEEWVRGLRQAVCSQKRKGGVHMKRRKSVVWPQTASRRPRTRELGQL